MALASGHWVDKVMKGEAPSPRYGHAVAVAGNIGFLFGGLSTMTQQDDFPMYLRDFFMFTVTPTHVAWEAMPQNGDVPSAREGHSLCVVKGKLYLFGGLSDPDAIECLAGVYCYDIMSLTWERLATGGVSFRAIRHSSVAVGDNIYVYGGLENGVPTDNLMVFNTVSLHWTPVKTTGTLPSARYNQTFALVGEQVFMFGGCAADGSYYKDLHVLNTDTLVWQKCDAKGESPLACAGQTLSAHHDKDLYLFGGKRINEAGAVTSINEIHKLSVAKMKWKVPLYVGIPPTKRHGHTAFILHSHMYVFGGKNVEQEFNDLKVMRLINPSERQPVMKEILSEFGLQGVSHGFVPTKVPNVKYELSEIPLSMRMRTAVTAQVTTHRDFSAVRDEAMGMIHKAFSMLDQEFQKLDRSCCSHELQEMLERHRAQNETWLSARAEENDKERKELCKLREDMLHGQERLKEEQNNIQKRSEHLLSIMQQFKGM
ncbi:uncharacterized protein FYW47_003826 [Aplochiton taeniatus]